MVCCASRRRISRVASNPDITGCRWDQDQNIRVERSKAHHFTIHKNAIISIETSLDHGFDSLGSICDALNDASTALELSTITYVSIYAGSDI